MAINTYPSTIESKKQNKQTSRTETIRYRERFNGARWEGQGDGWKR